MFSSHRMLDRYNRDSLPHLGFSVPLNFLYFSLIFHVVGKKIILVNSIHNFYDTSTWCVEFIMIHHILKSMYGVRAIVKKPYNSTLTIYHKIIVFPLTMSLFTGCSSLLCFSSGSVPSSLHPTLGVNASSYIIDLHGKIRSGYIKLIGLRYSTFLIISA